MRNQNSGIGGGIISIATFLPLEVCDGASVEPRAGSATPSPPPPLDLINHPFFKPRGFLPPLEWRTETIHGVTSSFVLPRMGRSLPGSMKRFKSYDIAERPRGGRISPTRCIVHTLIFAPAMKTPVAFIDL